MGLLAAFAGGAAQGVQSHWKDVRDRVAEEAKEAFQERLYERRRKDTLADYEMQREHGKEDLTEARAYEKGLLEENREYESEAAKQARLAELEDYEIKKGVDAKYAKPDPIDIGEMFINGPDGNPMKVKIDRRTGRQIGDPIPAYRNGSGGYGGYKPDLKPFFDPTDSYGEKKIPNVSVDTVTGMIVDPSGSLTKPAMSDTDIKSTIDNEVKQRDGSFGQGMTEADFRKAREQQLRNMTVAETLNIDPSKVVSSVNEIRNRMGQGGGLIVQPNQAQQGLVFDESDFMVEDDVSGDNQNNSRTPGENAVLAPTNSGQPESQQPQTPKPVELSEEERSALAEFGIEVDQPKLNQRIRNPHAGSDVTGTVKNFFTDNAPATTKLLSRAAQIPGNINEASMGAISGVIDAIAQKHRDMVAIGEHMKAADKQRLTERLTEAFFNGEPSVDAAKMVLENSSATARQKTAAQAYLKLKGQM